MLPAAFLDSRSRLRTFPVIAFILLVVLGLAAMLVVDRIERDVAVAQVHDQARRDAEILASGLRSELDKFSLVPGVLAEDLQVRDVLRGADGDRAILDRRLEQIAEQTGAAALYVMNREGLTLAASNWNLPTSFVGSNYGFRRYFRDAIGNGAATQFALGTVSRKPGLYIAQRVDDGSATLGLVVLKVEFDAQERSWRDAGVRALVSGPDGIVLIASEPSWRFRALRPINPSTRDARSDARQYGIASFEQFAIPGETMSAVDLPLGYPRGEPSAQWRLTILTDTGPRIKEAVETGRLQVLLAIIGLALALWLSLQWRKRREARTQAQLSARTASLREQLTQANRLATLGQVTAGVGHEIRQPVAAVRVYAENGERLLAAGDSGAAGENFRKITGLTVRIGEITEELLRFSRRGAREPIAMPLSQAIDGALLLLRDRIERHGATLVQPSPALTQTMVRAEPVRLEQVLVNLLQNALDAAPPGGVVVMEIAVEGNRCLLTVADDGPGLDEKGLDRLFQPFATTKQNGLGLGLVISLDIMRGLGGDLVARADPAGGRFTMIVPCA